MASAAVSAAVGGVLLAMIEGLQIALTKMMAEPTPPPYVSTSSAFERARTSEVQGIRL